MHIFFFLFHSLVLFGFLLIPALPSILANTCFWHFKTAEMDRGRGGSRRDGGHLKDWRGGRGAHTKSTRLSITAAPIMISEASYQRTHTALVRQALLLYIYSQCYVCVTVWVRTVPKLGVFWMIGVYSACMLAMEKKMTARQGRQR